MKDEGGRMKAGVSRLTGSMNSTASGSERVWSWCQTREASARGTDQDGAGRSRSRYCLLKKEIAPRRPKPSRRNLFTPRAAEAAARDVATAHVHAAVA